jgi:hypothetical protein
MRHCFKLDLTPASIIEIEREKLVKMVEATADRKYLFFLPPSGLWVFKAV